MIDQWRKQLQEPSGNLTTNEVMPNEIIEKLLEEDESLKENIQFEEVGFPKFDGVLNKIKGLDILAGLQSVQKEGSVTLFRAIRFPTYKRMYDVVFEQGYSVPNHEQERILELYKRPEYSQKRNEIKADKHFWTQPQERVVEGLPLFCLVNDALQIHRAYREQEDKTVIIAIHIPHELLKSGSIRLIANTAIDLEYTEDERDFEIKDFWDEGDKYSIDFEALRARGIDLHEMYSKNLPRTIEAAEEMGITQDSFLLDIYRIKKGEDYKELFVDTAILKKNKWFLHGFFGDQNIFGRRESLYLPSKCQRITKLL